MNRKESEQFSNFLLNTERFPNRSKLHGGIYFVNSLPKSPSGKLLRRMVTEQTMKLFREAKGNDKDLQSHPSDIPEEYRKHI